MKLTWIIIISSFCLLISGCHNDANNSVTDVTVDTLSSPKDSIEQQPIETVPKPLFETVPTGMYQSLNTKLAAAAKKFNPEQVIKMYYPAKIAKVNSYEKIDVRTEKKGKQTIVTLTHDNQSDHISIQGHRLIMTLEKQKGQWQIVVLKQQFKCWIRKDNTLWGTEKCS